MNNFFSRLKFFFRSRRAGMVIYSSLAQLILIAFSPILTRLYPPEIFGTYSVVQTIVGVSVVVGLFRYELFGENYSASFKRIFEEYIKIVAAVSTIFLMGILVMLVFFDYFFDGFHGVVVALLAIHYFSSLVIGYTNILLRRNKSDVINKSKILSVLIQCGTQFLFAQMTEGDSVIGLLFGQLMGQACGTWLLGRHINRPSAYKNSLKRTYFCTLILFKRIDYYSCFGGVLNAIGVAIPVLLIYNNYGPEFSGIYALVQRVFGVPVQIVSLSMASNFFASISDTKANIKSLVRREVKLTSVVALVIVVIYSSLGFYGVENIFGSKWSSANQVLFVLIPLNFVRLIVIPISQTLLILGESRWQFYWDLSRAIGVGGGILICVFFELDSMRMLYVYSLTSIFFYLVLVFLINHATSRLRF